MNVGNLVVFFLLAMYSVQSHAQEVRGVRNELIEIAQTIRMHRTKTNQIQRLEVMRKQLKSTESQVYRYAVLLDGFVSLQAGGNIERAEKAITLLRAKKDKRKDIDEWEKYCLRILQASIEGREGKFHSMQKSLNWLQKNVSVLERGKATNKVCAALIEGLEKGKGPFEAGLQMATSGNLTRLGREEEAIELYRSVVENFPDTGWAVSAKNRINHIKNRKVTSEIMNKKYEPDEQP